MSDWAPDIPQAVRSELPPFGIKPHWVTYGFSTPANRLYDLYNAHVNRDRGDLIVWPTLDDLAAVMGLSRGDKVAPYMRELEAGKAIEVETVTKTGGKGRRYVVTLKVHPPADYAGPLQASDWYRGHRTEKPSKPTMEERARGINSDETAGQKPGDEAPPQKRGKGAEKARSAPEAVNSNKTAGQDVHPPEGVDVHPVQGGDVHPPEGVVTSNNRNQNNSNHNRAPSARSAADARRAPAVGNARGSHGGSAAPEKPSSSSQARKAVRMTREQAAAVRAVEAALPPALVRLLPKYRPAVVRDALLAAVGDRTADQVVQRVNRRWAAWGYSVKAVDGEIERPVGVLVRLLERARWCPVVLCEDGVVLDTGERCRACEERRASRKHSNTSADGTAAAGTAVPGQRPAATGLITWACADCERPGKGRVPADGVCPDCRAAAEAAVQELATRWANEAAAAEAAQQAADRDEQEEKAREEAEARAAAAEHEARVRADAKETARIRAEIIRQHPELAAVSPSIAQSAGPAPF